MLSWQLLQQTPGILFGTCRGYFLRYIAYFYLCWLLGISVLEKSKFRAYWPPIFLTKALIF